MKELIIKNKIYTIRGKQVMLDSDLAELYNIPVKALNQAVKRNLERFPEEFMFQIEEKDIKFLRSQIVTTNKYWNKKRYSPYVFTEQGVAMLSAILKSKMAINVSINIMNAFVQMRNFLQSNAEIFQRLQTTEQKLLTHDNKIEEIFNLIQEKNIKPEKGIFYDGEIFDAHFLITKLIKEAKESIILIDNYIDETTLILFSQTKLPITIYTKNINEKLLLSLTKYNQQYNNIELNEFNKSHDRFLIIDEKETYHIGASLKDLGKRWFAFSKIKNMDLLTKLKEK